MSKINLSHLRELIMNNLLDIQVINQQIVWEKYSADQRNGVEIFPLYNARDKNNAGPAAALLRYSPGARVARHVHLGYELIFVLHGTLCNDKGEHKSGTLEICPPGSSHELWSNEGCIFLVVWEQPVATENIDEWQKKIAAQNERVAS